MAFNAPHYPLQAPKEDIERYWGHYDEGWETVCARRFEKQKRMGLFSADMELPAMPAHVRPWLSLSEQERKFESFRMAIYAVMVDRVDQNIGRLIAHLEWIGQLENTLKLICSDNGACPFERSNHTDIPPWRGPLPI